MYKINQSGFSLTELMVTLLVAGIVLGVGIPSFNDFIATNRMAAGVNDLASSMHLARTEAVKRRANVTICPSADPLANAPVCDNAGSFADGWIVFVDCTIAPPPAGSCGLPNYAIDNGIDTVLSTNSAMNDSLADNFSVNPANAPSYITYSAMGALAVIPALDPNQPVTDLQLCDQRGNHDIGGGIAAGRWIRISPTGRPQIFRQVDELQSNQNPLNGC